MALYVPAIAVLLVPRLIQRTMWASIQFHEAVTLSVIRLTFAFSICSAVCACTALKCRAPEARRPLRALLRLAALVWVICLFFAFPVYARTKTTASLAQDAAERAQPAMRDSVVGGAAGHDGLAGG